MCKSTDRHAALRGKQIALALATAFLALNEAQAQPAPNTLPTGGQVTAGSATISTSGSNMQIDQSTDRAILNWQSFSIGSSAAVNFSQPGASSVALNRVVGNTPSEIYGRLTANGQVFLTNNYGVLFAPGASVEVGGLMATTLSINDQDFLAGRYQFYNPGNAGSVVNQGTIITANGYTALAGPQVRNDGIIVARSGSVALAAGDRVTLDMIGDGLISVSVDQAAANASVVNTGTIQADGGSVLLTARSANALLDTVINTSGVIRANSLVERNGEIVLDGGNAGWVALAGTLEADTVTLKGNTVIEDASGAILAGTLRADTIGSAVLEGQNQVSSFSAASVVGSVALRNSGPLTVTGVSGGANVGLINDGDLTVRGNVTANGPLTVVAENLTVAASGPQSASLVSNGGQVIDVDSLTVSAANGGSAQITNSGSGDQLIMVDSGGSGSGIDVVTAGGGFATITNNAPSNQIIAVQKSDHIRVDAMGGLGTASIRAPNGTQVISITEGANAIQIGSAGSGASVVTGRNQYITVGQAEYGEPGSITIVGADIPSANGFITANAPGLSQVISTTGLISVTGGNALNAGIFYNSNGVQTITAGAIALQGGSGAGAAAAIRATGSGSQLINVSGPITITGGSGSSGSGAGLFGGTQTISAGGDVILTGGTSAGAVNGARIGNTAGPTGTSGGPTNLVLNVGGDLRLTGGSGAGNEAALGSADNALTARNDVTVNAQGNVILESGSGGGARIGSTFAAATPAAGDIAINAGGNIELNGIGQPTAIRTAGNVTLNSDDSIFEAANGSVQAGSLTTSSVGSTVLEGQNQVSSFSASSVFGSVALDNSGPLTVTGVNGGANVSLINDGDVTVSGVVTANGPVTLVAEDLTVTSMLLSKGGQLIAVHSLTVSPVNGGSAQITNWGSGEQLIMVDGGGSSAGIDVVATNGGFAGIANTAPGGNQTITVQKADHIRVDAMGGMGTASIRASNGTQAISITEGNNAIQIGSAGGGASVITARNQYVTAGRAEYGEPGSITIVGGAIPSANGLIGANAQVISTSGLISVTGGSSPVFVPNTNSGIFHNSTGVQTITAGAIALQGGSGVGTGVAIRSIGTGSQLINVAGSITVTGGTGSNGSGAGLYGGTQVINAGGDVTLTGGTAAGAANGARVGNTAGPSGTTAGPTNLVLNVGGDLRLVGGSGAGNEAALGSADNGLTARNDVTVNAQGNVILESGSGGGARIGSTFAAASPAVGNITIHAGGAIQLNGTDRPTAIRTSGDVVLEAASVGEGPNGFILAGTLNTATTGDASLTGPNQVASFSASSAAGDVLLNNTAPLLTVTSVTGQGIQIVQSGALDVVGNMTAVAAQDISATGDIHVGADSHAVEVSAGGPITMSSGGNLAVAGGSADGAHALVHSSGDINLTVGGFLTLDAGSGKDAWARIQLASRDSAISVYFPNLASGGYFVNGIEGELRDGPTGFLAGNGVAAPGHQFITTYGAP